MARVGDLTVICGRWWVWVVCFHRATSEKKYHNLRQQKQTKFTWILWSGKEMAFMEWNSEMDARVQIGMKRWLVCLRILCVRAHTHTHIYRQCGDNHTIQCLMQFHIQSDNLPKIRWQSIFDAFCWKHTQKTGSSWSTWMLRYTLFLAIACCRIVFVPCRIISMTRQRVESREATASAVFFFSSRQTKSYCITKIKRK